MPAITELSHSIWSRIAAGEVVERPASVLKELVENSLDAHAKSIKVSLYDGGRLRIIVQDDGEGIPFSELPLALTYHATSKISSLEDLEAISTLGYRGEALASLVAVSDVEIRSRPHDSQTGGLIRTHDGHITEHTEINCSKGTRVQVDNLFSGLPARRKFLKSASGELRRAAVYLREYAVCNPDVAFTLEHDSKEIFATDGAGLRERVLAKIWGSSPKIQNTQTSSQHTHLECWFQSKAGISSRNDLMAFVNGRAVSDPVIKGSVSSGARELAGNWALFFRIETSLVDVNIHPAKSEVRFRYPAEIYETVREAVKSLGAPMPLPEFITTLSAHGTSSGFAPALSASDTPSGFTNTPTSSHTTQLPRSNGWNFRDTPSIPKASPQISFQPQELINEPSVNYLGQTSGGYLVYDNHQALILMDPHAAHERVNYERIKSLAEKHSNTQQLLVPVLLHPTLALEAHEYEHELRLSGFELADTEKGVELRSIPSVPDTDFEPEVLLRASLGALRNNHDGDTLSTLWRTWATMACKASVKLTSSLSRVEALALWEKLNMCEQPFVCPHGRPTMIEIKNDELLKRFGRE